MKKLFLQENEEKALRLLSERLRTFLGSHLLSLTLFGSRVRGDFTRESDIDILLLLRKSTLEILDGIYDVLLDIELEYDSNISLKVYSLKEYEKNKQLGSPFVQQVEKEGVVL